MTLKKFFLFLITSSILMACGEDQTSAKKFEFVQNLNMDNIRNYVTVVESPQAHSGKNICHVDSGNKYGLIYDYVVPDSLINRNLSVSVDAWVKTGDIKNTCGIVCSIADSKDSVLFWHCLLANEFIKSPNEWSNLKNSINLPTQIVNRPNIRISIMPYNSDAKSYFDVDDLIITYSEIDN